MSPPYAPPPTPSAASSSSAGRAPLLLTRDGRLTGVLQRLAAAAGAALEVAGEPPGLARWGEPGLVLVGEDLAAEVAAVLPRRTGVALVSLGDVEDPEVWRLAVLLGADQVAVLPAHQDWVVQALAESLDGPRRCSVVGVVGGVGGAGASVLAAGIAVAAAVRGRRTLLVDLDPLGGGVELLLGAEEVSGLRWSELARARGRLGGGMLREALPRLDGLSFLSWDRSEPGLVPADASVAVAAGAVRGFDLVVLDLPRSLASVAPAWLRCIDLGLVILPANLRAVAAASRVVNSLEVAVSRAQAVVRAGGDSGPDADAVADSLQLPLLGELRAEPGLAAAMLRGEPPGLRARGPLARLAGRVLQGLPAGGLAA
jgi:secretion/DNA translocation related CpaE-like protein